MSSMTAEELPAMAGPSQAGSDGARETNRHESVFEAVFLKYYDRVVGLLFRLLGDRARAEELAGKTILVSPATPVPAPRVVLRWKDDQQEPVTQHIHAGYAMKLTFGRIADNKIYGRIYIALPDEHRSFAAGNFEAEISRPTEPLAGR